MTIEKMKSEPKRAPSGPFPGSTAAPGIVPIPCRPYSKHLHHPTVTQALPHPEPWGWKLGSSCHSYSVQMRPLMLGAVAGVTERLLAAGMLAQIRLLACVAPQVDLEIFEP